MRSLLSPEQFATFLSKINALALSDAEVAAAAGISIHTIRFVRASGEAPVSARCREAIALFLARNGAARTRGDVRLAAAK